MNKNYRQVKPLDNERNRIENLESHSCSILHASFELFPLGPLKAYLKAPFSTCRALAEYLVYCVMARKNIQKRLGSCQNLSKITGYPKHGHNPIGTTGYIINRNKMKNE